MSLAAPPTFTAGSPGNVITTSTSLGASPATVTSSTFYVGVSGQSGSAGSTTTGAALGGTLQIVTTGGGTVTAGSLVTISLYRAVDTSTNMDTVPVSQWTLATVQSGTARVSIDIPPGIYQVKLANGDSNSITVSATLGTTG